MHIGGLTHVAVAACGQDGREYTLLLKMKGGESGPRAVGNRFMEIGHILCFFSRLGGDFYPPMAGCWFGWFGSWNNKKSFVKGKVTVCSTHAHTHTHGVLTVDHGPTLPH